MTTLAIWLIRNWHLSALACLTAFAVVQSQRLTISQQTVLALNTKIAEANQIAAEYQEASEANLETLRTSIPLMVAQAQANAVANYRKKFGAPVKCVAPVGLLPSGSSTPADTTASAEGANDPSSQLLADCASDAARLTAWQQWATMNHLPIK